MIIGVLLPLCCTFLCLWFEAKFWEWAREANEKLIVLRAQKDAEELNESDTKQLLQVIQEQETLHARLRSRAKILLVLKWVFAVAFAIGAGPLL